jgi:predicted nucleotidyltransferase
MSVSIEKGATFLGIPLVTVRNVLKAWRYGKSEDAHEIGVRKDVSLDPRTVIVLLDELRDRGLIGPEKSDADQEFDGVTEAGASLLAAKATRRVNKARAWKILKSFLNACAEINTRSDLPFDVQEVWLFGSMIDDNKGDVADIDIAPVFGRPKPFSDFKVREARFRELANQMGGAAVVNNAGVFAPFRAESYVIGQLIYGGHRHHLLAPNDLDQLLRLACPCKLIFDKKRGGEVDDPVLPRHPNSSGRSNSIGDRHAMPDLLANRKILRPLPVCMTEPGRFHYRTMIETGQWPEDDWPYRWIQDKQSTSKSSRKTCLPRQASGKTS